MKPYRKSAIAIGGISALTVTALAGYFWYAANHDPYPEQRLGSTDIPVFHEVSLPFHHRYDEDHALPFIGGTVFDLGPKNRNVVFVGGGRNQQDAVYQFKDNRFQDISKGAHLPGKSLPDATYGVSSMDMNGDGLTDLVVARDSGVYLLPNKGDGFDEALKLEIPLNDKSTPLSVTLGDLDHDGLADMFISAYIKKSAVAGETIFNQPGYGATSLLLHNEGNNRFSDITRASGIFQIHNTFTAVLADLDDDNWLDLVVAQDTGHLFTWRNNHDGTFQDVSQPARIAYAYPMGLALADTNGNGRLDIWASNVARLPEIIARGDLRPEQTLNKAWILLRNDGGFRFVDEAANRKLADYEFSWGGIFRDFNLDGREDLSVSESYIGLLPHKVFPLPGRLLIQTADGKFAPTEKASGLENRYFGISPLSADFNLDGAPDLIQLNLDGPVRAFLSAKPRNHYLKVRLPDSPAYVPSKVVVEMQDGRKSTKWNLNGEGLCTDQSNEIIFGLAENSGIARVLVKKPNGEIKSFHATADTTLELSQ